MLININALDQRVTGRYALYHGDACELIGAIPDDTIHFGIHSPPFEGLYKFSNSDRDLSNGEGGVFWEHYAFLIREMLRTAMPGRLHSVHVMQLPTTKFRDGHIGMRDFRGDVVRAYTGNDAAELYAAMRRVRARAAAAAMNGDIDRAVALTDAAARIEEDLQANPGEAGWIFHSEVCIWKDPVVAQQRTKSIRLLHKQLCKDSALSGQGLADYIVTFRKPGDNPEAVAGPLDAWVGNEELDVSPAAYEADVAARRTRGQEAWPFEQWRSILVWQRYASPVWTDIRQTRTLQYRGGRDEKDEQHISPLQLDVIERCVDLWSNPGETVFTPFAGIGSEVYAAVEMGRRGLGFELKPSYFAQSLKNMDELDARLDEMEALLS